ncbi:hypothetical protein BN1708_020291, partial [Verticillium longisporum]
RRHAHPPLRHVDGARPPADLGPPPLDPGRGAPPPPLRPGQLARLGRLVWRAAHYGPRQLARLWRHALQAHRRLGRARNHPRRPRPRPVQLPHPRLR